MARFRRILLLVLLAAVAVACDWDGGTLAKTKPVSWKVIDDALLRVNDAPIKDWNVYQTGKKQDPLLLQMGTRFLLIEVHDRRVFEIDPTKIERKSDEIMWDPSERPAQPLATSDWMASDMGAAFKIEVKVDSENRALDLQLPHPPDIGDLPARSTAPATRRRY
jgi:hypothetical protein